MMFELLTPLMIGLFGSFHCVGMCGPIAVALPLNKQSFWGKVAGPVSYNLGRSLTYAILGLIFGLLGRGIQLAGLQQAASILLGTLMVLTVISPYIFKQKLKITGLVSGYTGQMTKKLRKLFSHHSFGALLGIGLLNGLLPCGLVYVAIAGAINTNHAVSGAAFRFLFGLGTIPLMLGISLSGNLIGAGLRSTMRRMVPYFVVALGILFILRGLSLGIPFVSPSPDRLVPIERGMSTSDGH